jgi:hypothetical protein
VTRGSQIGRRAIETTSMGRFYRANKGKKCRMRVKLPEPTIYGTNAKIGIQMIQIVTVFFYLAYGLALTAVCCRCSCCIRS